MSVRLGNACDVPHFRVEEQILIVVALVHEQPVYPQLFKRDHIILPALVIQTFQLCVQIFPCLFHLLDRVPCAFFFGGFFNGQGQLVNLPLYGCLLPLNA